ncbi:Structural maintenance of chromosomes protein 5 [Chlorella vulgaris]
MDSSGPSRRPVKRQKVERYPRGAILRVEMQNFMTYRRATIEPGPKLNLVLGPNGTGKSTLVCAICVCLAGKASLLGRAEDVSGFVRRGSDAGWVEITLSSGSPTRPYTIRREIRRDTNSSKWYLNRQECRMKDVEELVRDHLKFLPQDKVVEFARMSPVDLLAATEKAIGNGELHEHHMQLIKVRKEMASHDTHTAALEESVAQHKADNSRNTRDVQNIQRREQLLAEVQLARQRMPWMQYDARFAAYEKDKQMRNSARTQLQQREAAQQEEEGPLAARQQLLSQLKREKEQLAAAITAADVKLVGAVADRGGRGARPGLDEEMNAALELVQAKQQDITGLAEAAATRERRMEEMEEAIGALQEAVAALPPAGDMGEPGRQRLQLSRELGDINTQAWLFVNSLGGQLAELHTDLKAVGERRQAAEGKLRQIDDSKMRRLQALNQRHRNILAAWQWLQANKTRFRYPVFGPVALEVECPDQQHLQYLEQQVAANVWSFFVTQCHEDQDLLDKEFCSLGFRPSIACVSSNAVSAPIEHPKGEASGYARYGISQTLDSVFTAPAVIKRLLCDESRINEVYLGDRSTRVEDLLRDVQKVQFVYTPGSRYSRTRSNYNRAAESTMVSDVRPARLLTGAATVDDGRHREQAQADIQQCMRDASLIEQQMRGLQEQQQDKQSHLTRLKAQMAQLDEHIKHTHARHNAQRTKLHTKRNELDRLRKQPDPRKRQPRLQQELERACNTAFSKAIELAEVQASQAQRLMDITACELAVREAAMQVEKLKAACQRRAAELLDWQTKVRRLEELCKRSVDECRKLKQRAEAEAPRTEELEQQWAEANDGQGLPVTQEGLQDFLNTKMAEADGMLVSNPAALEQYHERCAMIAAQEQELAVLEEKRGLARATIDDVTSRWLPELQRIVAQVNATFSENFKSVGCAGDVVLHEAPGEDFEKYAIEIRVKFRDNEDLQTLDSNRQSGGERSVSTILYLIALQGVTVTPFRVVDEINQGMDPINERKVFMQLVEAACGDGTPQCFLLTPKLLPNLPFTRDVSVLQIMNGGHIKDVAVDFKVRSMLGRKHLELLAAA